MGTCVAVLLALGPLAHSQDWKPLFNGKDLDGWDTWLGRPHEEKEIVGLNKDPKKVYTVVEVDGKPAIRISGEIFGALTSKDEFENYHLQARVQVGREEMAAAREGGARQRPALSLRRPARRRRQRSGCSRRSARSRRSDCGDFWSVAGAIVDVEGERKDGKGPVIYKKGGTKFTVPSKGIGGPHRQERRQREADRRSGTRSS